MSSFSDLPSVLRFHLCHVSLKQLKSVLVRFGTLEAALQASRSDWLADQLLSEKQVAALQSAELPGLVEHALRWGEQTGQRWLPYGDPLYPSLLTSINEAPLLLSVRGQAELLSDPQLAVVGSRHASKQGVNIAKDFSQHLSSQGLAITSGLALGVDTAAHQGGLMGIGKTVAVVGTGLDRIYPAANQTLARQIAEEGVMVSEFPLGTPPLAQNFPKRNRIISGLSTGVLVVEAALKSGSLITAKRAMEQGREVFAVPGSIHNPQAKGCHQLIKQGAKLVESGQDVLEELSALIRFSLTPAQESLSSSSRHEGSKSVSEPQQPILAYIEYEPISVDELVVLSKRPIFEIQSQLTLLELSGEIEAMSAGRWRRIR